MISFEDVFILALYFGSMLGIVLFAYYSQYQEENEDIYLNIPLPPSPIIYQSNDELEESKEESKEDVDEYHLEQGLNQEVVDQEVVDQKVVDKERMNQEMIELMGKGMQQIMEQVEDLAKQKDMMIDTDVNNNSSVINRKEISELESQPDVISIQEEDTKKNQ